MLDLNEPSHVSEPTEESALTKNDEPASITEPSHYKDIEHNLEDVQKNDDICAASKYIKNFHTFSHTAPKRDCVTIELNDPNVIVNLRSFSIRLSDTLIEGRPSITLVKNAGDKGVVKSIPEVPSDTSTFGITDKNSEDSDNSVSPDASDYPSDGTSGLEAGSAIAEEKSDLDATAEHSTEVPSDTSTFGITDKNSEDSDNSVSPDASDYPSDGTSGLEAGSAIAEEKSDLDATAEHSTEVPSDTSTFGITDKNSEDSDNSVSPDASDYPSDGTSGLEAGSAIAEEKSDLDATAEHSTEVPSDTSTFGITDKNSEDSDNSVSPDASDYPSDGTSGLEAGSAIAEEKSDLDATAEHSTEIGSDTVAVRKDSPTFEDYFAFLPIV